jgi:hypothetical protein
VIWTGTNIQYGINCHSNNNIFGCVGLRGKSFCILNKQYSEEEFKSLVPRIIEHMNAMPYVDARGRTYRYGEFFPSEISPFAYNETIANDYFPLNKDTATEKGFVWRESDKPQREPTLRAADLPDHIKDVEDSVLNEVIGCATCGRPFRIIQKELEFLRRFRFALPRECPECRHKTRFKKVNLPFLYRRRCMCDYQIYQNTTSHIHHPQGQCLNEFETTYFPGQSEVVYCEQCYQAEVA